MSLFKLIREFRIDFLQYFLVFELLEILPYMYFFSHSDTDNFLFLSVMTLTHLFFYLFSEEHEAMPPRWVVIK